jgi:hypothetical protein
MANAEPPPVLDQLETLKAMLSAAARMVAQYAERSFHPLRMRWERVFDRLPPQDRETVVAAVEREVDLRVETMGDGEPIVGLSELRPNPGARLYLRVFEGALPDLHRDEIMLSTLRAARIMFRADAPPPDIFGDAVHAAFRALSREERAALARHNRYMLQLLATCEADDEAAARSAK